MKKILLILLMASCHDSENEPQVDPKTIEFLNQNNLNQTTYFYENGYPFCCSGGGGVPVKCKLVK